MCIQIESIRSLDCWMLQESETEKCMDIRAGKDPPNCELNCELNELNEYLVQK